MFKLDSKKELEAIRWKVMHKQYDFNKTEVLCLSQVYAEIQKKALNRDVKPLDMSCSSCVQTAANIVHNYIKFHEPVDIEPAKETKVVIVKTTKTRNNGKRNTKAK